MELPKTIYEQTLVPATKIYINSQLQTKNSRKKLHWNTNRFVVKVLNTLAAFFP